MGPLHSKRYRRKKPETAEPVRRALEFVVGAFGFLALAAKNDDRYQNDGEYSSDQLHRTLGHVWLLLLASAAVLDPARASEPEYKTKQVRNATIQLCNSNSNQTVDTGGGA